MLRPLIAAGAAVVLLAGCQTDSRRQVLQTTHSQAAQRSISTRYFETEKLADVFQAVLSSLQDLGFVVDRADPALGTVSATKFDGGLTRFTVSVRAGSVPAGGSGKTIVRASGQVNQTEISDPAAFQRFFDALEQALFLQANRID